MKPDTTTYLTRWLLTMLCLGLSVHVYAKDYNASLDWSMRSELSLPVNGVIQSVKVDVGSKVKKGAVLLQLVTTVINSQVREAKSVLANKQAVFDEAQRELDRATQLFESTVLSVHDFQTAKDNLLLAQAGVDHAKAIYAQRRFEQTFSAVRAPFDLIVIERHAQPGELVNNNNKKDVLFVVAEADYMIARVVMSIEEIATVDKNTSISVTVSGRNYEGKLHIIQLQPDSNQQGKYPVEFRFKTNGDVLFQGQAATVTIN